MQITRVLNCLGDVGAKPPHIRGILRAWLLAQPLDSGRRRERAEDFLPLALREALPALSDELQRLATVKAVFPGANGERLLLALADGQRQPILDGNVKQCRHVLNGELTFCIIEQVFLIQYDTLAITGHGNDPVVVAFQEFGKYFFIEFLECAQ